MIRARAAVLIMLSLAVVALLSATAPAGAHPGSPGASAVGAPVLLSSASAPTDRSLPLLAAIALGAVGLGLGVEGARRHPRRALLLLFVLRLAVFAFEDGLHSVHHGFDTKQYGECTIAAASAHLCAVSVDGVPAMAVALVPAAATAVSDPASLPTRLLKPHQGRAPPLAVL